MVFRDDVCNHFECRWAEARIKIARMTLTIKLDGNWSSFQLANNTPPLSVTGSVIAPSARMADALPASHGCSRDKQMLFLHGRAPAIKAVRRRAMHSRDPPAHRCPQTEAAPLETDMT